VMQDQNLELQPLSRNLSPGQSATLSGTVLGKLTNPKVRYTDAVGKLEQPPAPGPVPVTVPDPAPATPGTG